MTHEEPTTVTLAAAKAAGPPGSPMCTDQRGTRDLGPYHPYTCTLAFGHPGDLHVAHMSDDRPAAAWASGDEEATEL